MTPIQQIQAQQQTGGQMYPISSGDGGYGKAVMANFAPNTPLGHALTSQIAINVGVANIVTTLITAGESGVVGGL